MIIFQKIYILLVLFKFFKGINMKKNKLEQKSKPIGVILFISITIAVIIIVFASQFLFDSKNQSYLNLPVTDSSQLTGLDAFANCLTENDAVFYGTEWCGFCTQQKNIFGDSMKYINYIDCDRNRNICSAQGITGFPTWKIKGQSYPGVQSLDVLASRTGCEL